MESTHNIEKILSALKEYPWTKGGPIKEENGVRKFDTISMLLLRAGVPEQEIPTLSMANTWRRYGDVLAREYGLRDNTDYYLILVAGDSSRSQEDMLNRVAGVLKGDLKAIAPFYREWITSLVANRSKTNEELEQPMKIQPDDEGQDASAKYRDLRWQKRRVEILERDKERCQGVDENGKQCGVTQKKEPLEIHHRNRTTPDHWDEPSENLIALCDKHHEQESNLELSKAATEVCNALKKSNWMAWQRKLLAKCISEKIISPEELCQLIRSRVQ